MLYIPFTASITRIPYVGNEDYFSLNNYLESIGKDFDTSLTNEFNEKVAEEILEEDCCCIEGACIEDYRRQCFGWRLIIQGEIRGVKFI
jgi:hypothetical protein